MLSACAGSPNSDLGPRGRRGEGAVLTFEVPQDDQDADVFVDGNYVGQVSEVQGAVRVAPGKHRVEVRKPGRFPIQKTIKVEANRREQTRQVRGELLANPLDS
jgi:hypothetical protein